MGYYSGHVTMRYHRGRGHAGYHSGGFFSSLASAVSGAVSGAVGAVGGVRGLVGLAAAPLRLLQRPAEAMIQPWARQLGFSQQVDLTGAFDQMLQGSVPPEQQQQPEASYVGGGFTQPMDASQYGSPPAGGRARVEDEEEEYEEEEEEDES